MISLVKTRTPQPQSNFDSLLLWMFAGLLSLGLVMVYSASIAIAEGSEHTGYQAEYYLIRQSIFIAFGLLAGLVVSQIPIKLWEDYAPYLFLFGVVLLIAVLIFGREINGSRRWLSLFFFNFQPSELMKFFVVLYAADYAVRKGHLTDQMMQTFLPMVTVMVVVGSLLLMEPDMGAFAVICAIAISVLWLGGFHMKPFLLMLLLLPVVFGLLIWLEPYRMERVAMFMDPWQDPFGSGYQLTHALIAFGRGEWTGVGLGASVEKLFYLPEAHTDFLIAVIGEELGFLGVLGVVVMFSVVVIRAFQIGRHANYLDRRFAALVAQGIGTWIGVQAFINMGVNMGILPTKGLTLPFMSYGGSSIVVNCIIAAVLLRIDYENRLIAKGQSV